MKCGQGSEREEGEYLRYITIEKAGQLNKNTMRIASSDTELSYRCNRDVLEAPVHSSKVFSFLLSFSPDVLSFFF